MGKDGSRETRKEVTATVWVGDGPGRSPLQWSRQEMGQGGAQGRDDGSSDPSGGDRASEKQFNSPWIGTLSHLHPAPLDVECGLLLSWCGPPTLTWKGASWHLCLLLPSLKPSILDSCS